MVNGLVTSASLFNRALLRVAFPHWHLCSTEIPLNALFVRSCCQELLVLLHSGMQIASPLSSQIALRFGLWSQQRQL